MKRIIYILLIPLTLLACNSSSSDTETEQAEEKTTQNNDVEENSASFDEKEYVSIEGDDIWVRSQPTDGEVLMKLNNGTKCELLQKGKQETINGVTDFWYQIKYDEKTGWVFGSQTNLKNVGNQNKRNESYNEEEFIVSYLNRMKNSGVEELADFFVNQEVYQMYNPGAIVYITKVNYKELMEADIFRLDLSKFNGKIITDRMPTFSMEDYTWSEEGYFLEKVKNTKIMSPTTEFVADTYAEDMLKQIKEDEQKIMYKFLIAYGDGVVIYFGKIDNDWKIITIDVSTNDA